MASGNFPLYHRIFLQLREQILTQQYQEGDCLPGETELAARFGVSRITTKRALNELEVAGFVSREQGRGTIVRPNAVKSSAFDGTLESLRASNRLIGESHTEIIAFAQMDRHPEVQKALQVPHDTPVFRIERVRSAMKIPFCHVTAYVPEPIGKTFSRKELETTMLADLIERTGAIIERAEQDVSATIASSEMAALLMIQPGAPLIQVTRTVYARDDRPVEYFNALFRPDQYRISMTLSRRETVESAESKDNFL
jgi:GntR family transcriptional regulator